MPHIIVEYADDVLNQQGAILLCQQLFNVVEETAMFEPANIKVRMYPVSIYKTASESNGFIHVQCRIHRGRTAEQKKFLTQSITNVLCNMEIIDCIFTAEVIDIDTESYSKLVC